MSRDVLVLNRHYYAIHVSNWQKAMSLLYKGHAHALDEDMNRYSFDEWKDLSQMIKDNPSGFIKTVSFKIAVPEVIALAYYDELPKSEVKFTRKNLYHNYKNICCYCNKKFKTENLNLDHILPRSQGGKTEWKNIVLSCIPCNSKKANRTPKESNLKMYYEPFKPHWKPSYTASINTGMKLKTSWKKFIDNVYWNSELEE